MTPPRTQLLGLTCILGLTVLLQACSLLGSKTQVPLQIYALDTFHSPVLKAVPASRQATVNTAVNSSAGKQRVIMVNIPSAAPGYDSARMMYVRKAGALEAFSQSAWVDTPARMLAPLVVQALQQGGQFRAVVLAPSAAKADLRLEASIVRLQQNFLRMPSQVRLTLHVTLMDNTESPRVLWRLQPLRRWSHEQKIKSFFSRSTRTRCTHGA